MGITKQVDLATLEKILIRAAEIHLLPYFAKAKRSRKKDGSIVTEADIGAQKYIRQQLKIKYPEIAMLGEEMSASAQAKVLNTEKNLWCLDPIDGTSNFAAGFPFFSISLALLESTHITLAIVYDPIRKECFSASQNQEARLNGEPLELNPAQPLSLEHSIASIDFKRLPINLRQNLVTKMPFASQRNLGSIALEWCWLAANRYHIYLHGKQQLWDYAAGWYIFSKIGGQACTLEGGEIFNHDLAPKSAVGALDKKLFLAWTNWLDITHNQS